MCAKIFGSTFASNTWSSFASSASSPPSACARPATVLRHVPRVLPCVAFGVVAAVAAGGRIEGFAEAAVALARAHEAGGRIEGVLPVGGARFEARGNVAAPIAPAMRAMVQSSKAYSSVFEAASSSSSIGT
jgi:hypothetical protein